MTRSARTRRTGTRPGLLIGGQSDKAFQRAAKYADGWTMGGAGPDAFTAALGKLKAAWSEAGRDGEPRTSALFYFSLGPDAENVAARNLGDYYSFLSDYAQRIVQSAAKDAATLNGYVSAFEQAGVDEIICFPASSDPAAGRAARRGGPVSRPAPGSWPAARGRYGPRRHQSITA